MDSTLSATMATLSLPWLLNATARWGMQTHLCCCCCMDFGPNVLFKNWPNRSFQDSRARLTYRHSYFTLLLYGWSCVAASFSPQPMHSRWDLPMFSICIQDGSIPRSILCDESERLKLLTTKGWNIIQTPFQVRKS